MLATQLTLDFACCRCKRPIEVTLRCEGVGLAAKNPVAAALIPCPHCAGYSRIFFSPDGTLHRVVGERPSYRFLESCPN